MRRSLALFALAFLGCKPAQTPASVNPVSPDLTPPAENTTLESVAVDVTPPAVSSASGVAGASATAQAPAVLPAPPGKLAAALCKVNGKPFTPSALIGANQRSIAADGKGGLYVPDDTSVRRYLTQSEGDQCNLVPDAKFGRGGSIDVKFQVYRLSIDPAGNVLACGWNQCALISGKKVLPACDAPFGRRKRIAEEPEDTRKERKTEPHGMLALTAFGSVGGGVSRMRTLMGVEIEDLQCKVEAHWILEDFAISAVARFADTFYVTGRDGQGVSKLLIHDLKQGRLGEVVSEEPPSEKAMCWVSSMVPCGEGLCMLDTQCNRVTVVDKKGAFVNSYKLLDLLHTELPLRPVAIAPASSFEHFLLAHEPAPKGAEPRIYRVRNLPGVRE
ncbi:MAG: hypothetical protein SFV15_25350 [Polyangiaceae bacterium]|nr:hypothetical protein [Polyangiaceae bacterium]